MPDDNFVQENEIVLSGEAATEYEELQDLGISASEIKELYKKRDEVEALERKVAIRSREIEVESIVHALESSGDHDGVVRIDGYRHYPVVINAVEEALSYALAMDSSEGDGAAMLDNAVLSIVNAIPVSGRISIEADGGVSIDHPAGNSSDGDDGIKEDTLDKFIEEIS